jgi:glycosyltransferase involved in cell wall biosynthesis
MRPAGAHIALFLPSLHGGGLERIMVSLANAFAAYGLAVDLVVGHADGPYRDRVSRRVNVVDLKKRRLLSCWPALALYLRRNVPTVLLSTPNQANVVAILASKAARVGTRVVVREASTLSLAAKNARNRRGHLRPFYTALFYRLADQIVAISEGVADDLVACTGIDRSRISVIYNPIELFEILSEAAQPLDDPWFQAGQPPVVLGAGRLTKAKDFPTLIRAFDRLRHCHEARLVILGEGEERPHLKRLISQLGIERDVALPGFVRNPFAYMARARVFALSSAWEGFGNVLLEALVCGTPVVSTDCSSGPAEILENGAYGILVPVGDHVALADALAQALASPPDRARNQDRVTAFSRQRIVEQYLAALDLKEPGPARKLRPTVHAHCVQVGGSLPVGLRSSRPHGRFDSST